MEHVFIIELKFAIDCVETRYQVTVVDIAFHHTISGNRGSCWEEKLWDGMDYGFMDWWLDAWIMFFLETLLSPCVFSSLLCTETPGCSSLFRIKQHKKAIWRKISCTSPNNCCNNLKPYFWRNWRSASLFQYQERWHTEFWFHLEIDWIALGSSHNSTVVLTRSLGRWMGEGGCWVVGVGESPAAGIYCVSGCHVAARRPL